MAKCLVYVSSRGAEAAFDSDSNICKHALTKIRWLASFSATQTRDLITAGLRDDVKRTPQARHTICAPRQGKSAALWDIASPLATLGKPQNDVCSLPDGNWISGVSRLQPSVAAMGRR